MPQTNIFFWGYVRDQTQVYIDLHNLFLFFRFSEKAARFLAGHGTKEKYQIICIYNSKDDHWSSITHLKSPFLSSVLWNDLKMTHVT